MATTIDIDPWGRKDWIEKEKKSKPIDTKRFPKGKAYNPKTDKSKLRNLKR